jgi:hypothetical protein
MRSIPQNANAHNNAWDRMSFGLGTMDVGIGAFCRRAMDV